MITRETYPRLIPLPARLLLVLGIVLSCSCSIALASGTPMGTVISNQATVTYTDPDGTEQQPVYANTLSFSVGQIAVVNVAPATGEKITHLKTIVDYSVKITNSGNGPDHFTVHAASSLKLAITVYHDADGDGILSDNERGAGPITESGIIAADEQFAIIARVQIPDSGSLNGKIDTLNIRATSAFDTTRSASGSYVTTIASALLNVASAVSNPLATAASRVTYTISYNNRGRSAATSVKVTDVLNGNLRYVYGSATPAPSSASGQTLTWDLGSVNNGVSGTITFMADVANGLRAGSEIHNTADAAFKDGNNDLAVSSAESSFITIASGGTRTIALSPDRTSSGEPGDTVDQSLTLTNNGVAAEAFRLSSSSSGGLQWTFYKDLDSNGQIDPGEPIVDSTGTVPGGGGFRIVARTMLPRVASNRTIDSTTFRTVSTTNASNAVQCSSYTTINIPVMTLVKSSDPSTQRSGGEITYTINYSNIGSGRALEFQVVDLIPANTAYIPGSIRINSVAKTDAADNDEAQFSGGTLTINLGTIMPSSSGSVEFRVRIN